MEYRHTAVLADETVSGLNVRPEGIYADGTLGAGGHAALICAQLNARGTLIGIDRDAEALAEADRKLAKFSCRRIFVRDNFRRIKEICRSLGAFALDGAVLDLGVSSYQLDNPERGFSYMNDGPLDMRMDGGADGEDDTALTAYRIINSYSEQDIARMIKTYGEERWAKRIAGAIVRRRSEAPIGSTVELAEIIKSAIPAAARREGPHPAKRTFQAVRIEVNDELAPLAQALTDSIDMLAPKGRIAVITFHSLEDRIAKEVFAKRENPCECPPGIPECVCGKRADARRVTKKPITASATELAENPRARSAKLRILEKL
ncbi:MAG: 16S rRNA (cytosine(1402)-N(4))-methyltransferase RsmH [Clostridiales Family XIII bacterium]|jgi:16S rRNA (cytosine1402-N4)-methyltransferase|nr:16S rRNA (cytosine(1402)-N(4))-methyltransferase RsmH [Clostridiales Family XIII bacterium]